MGMPRHLSAWDTGRRLDRYLRCWLVLLLLAVFSDSWASEMMFDEVTLYPYCHDYKYPFIVIIIVIITSISYGLDEDEAIGYWIEYEYLVKYFHCFVCKVM